MAEKQSTHRQELERREQTIEAWLSFCGVVSALAICLAAIAGGVFCILRGQSISGTLLGGAGLAAVVGAFLYGRRKARPRA